MAARGRRPRTRSGHRQYTHTPSPPLLALILTVSELSACFNDVRDDSRIGAVILTGAGDAAFCSGGDQGARGDGGYVGSDGVPRLNVLDLQVQIRRLPKPVLAAVAGYAVGGGNVLATVCDLTIAADNAIFGQTGPKVGSFDGGYGATQLARVVGQKKAREIWFLARLYDAQEAAAMGLVNAVVPLSDLEATAVAWCREMVRNSPTALRVLKASLNAADDGHAGLQARGGEKQGWAGVCGKGVGRGPRGVLARHHAFARRHAFAQHCALVRPAPPHQTAHPPTSHPHRPPMCCAAGAGGQRHPAVLPDRGGRGGQARFPRAPPPRLCPLPTPAVTAQARGRAPRAWLGVGWSLVARFSGCRLPAPRPPSAPLLTSAQGSAALRQHTPRQVHCLRAQRDMGNLKCVMEAFGGRRDVALTVKTPRSSHRSVRSRHRGGGFGFKPIVDTRSRTGSLQGGVGHGQANA